MSFQMAQVSSHLNLEENYKPFSDEEYEKS
jgi:hypothetical protein